MGNIDLNLVSKVGIGDFTMDNLFSALLVLVICLVAIKLLMSFFTKALEKSKIERTLHKFLRSAVHITLYVLTVLIVMAKLDIDPTSLIAFLSVAGLAVSLAVQGTLSNIAGGIMILISTPFVVGDYVEAGDVSGTVSEIGLSYTRFMTVDNKTVFVPNSDIAAAKIINYTKAEKRRVDITVGASYDCPVATVKKALFAAAARHEQILKDPPVFVNVVEYKDSCIDYVLRAWVPTDDYWKVYYALLEDIKEEFDANSVEMTYPHVNVHIEK